ncbi:MAG: hypothetical protein QUS12_11765, partial [Methanosarcina sp.]|nr:hypothetical protein [Methanosarcina sp.]
MADINSWDWQNPDKKIPFQSWKEQYEWVEEPYVSPDGEEIAAIVRNRDGEFTVCVNGKPWETSFEKIYQLRFTPGGKPVALVSADMEWTVAVDGTPWENRFSFVWNPLFSKDGEHIAVAFDQDMSCGVAVDDTPWDNTFRSISNTTISPDGARTSAAVQTEAMDQADIDKFNKGIYSAAPDGNPWNRNFTNVWHNVFSPDSQKLAAEVRLNRFDYTIAVDGEIWDSIYPVSYTHLT